MNQPKELTKLLKFNADIREEINSRISKFYDLKITESKAIDPEFTRLLKENKDYILSGGKRLRPTLAMIGYMASGGKETKSVLDAAMAFEIFHSFLLMHDDIMDGDTYRYGGPNIAGRYEAILDNKPSRDSAKHFATSMAIIAGDLNEAFTFEIISNLNIDDATKLNLMGHIQKTLFYTAAGQQLDASTILSDKPPNINKLSKINNFKTAIYTISSPLNFGVLFNGGNKKLESKFNDLAVHLGKAFQLADDLIGVFGSSDQNGREECSDIREGKHTVLMYYANSLAGKKDWEIIKSRLGKNDITKKDVNLLRNILVDCGAKDKVHKLANNYLKQTQDIIDSLAIDNESKELLGSFAFYCVNRNK